MNPLEIAIDIGIILFTLGMIGDLLCSRSAGSTN